jgi:signal transduction histidine kinase
MDWAYSGWLAILSLTFLSVTLFFSRNLDQTISKSITLDLHNQQLLEEVTHARDKEQQANTEKSRFLASVSHDLRQPLYAMSLFMESLKALTNTQEQQKILERARQSRDDLDDMFDALLEVSQLETGSIKPVFKHVELQPVIDSLLNNFSEHANNKQLKIDNNHCDAVVKTDPVLLARILNNLLSNAIKYTDEGHISIICQVIDDQLEIKICDTGCGISEDQQSVIFNEYHQLNNPERDKNKGLGLGLTVVKKISQLLKHTININSTPGRGSEFSVLLPLGDADLVTKNKPLANAQCFSNLHIMLIEDNSSVREATSSLLKQWKYKVSAYASEQQAVADLRENPQRPPDMIICDYRLADNKNGTQAIAAVRKLVDMKLPALIITADTDPETKTEISALGYFMIKKPVRPAYLKNIINEMLS